MSDPLDDVANAACPTRVECTADARRDREYTGRPFFLREANVRGFCSGDQPVTARATGRRRGRAEGDSRNQREEEQKQKNKNTSSSATLAVHDDELGRTIFSLSRLLSVVLDREKQSNKSPVAFAIGRSSQASLSVVLDREKQSTKSLGRL
jgi:hypothetical protein